MRESWRISFSVSFATGRQDSLRAPYGSPPKPLRQPKRGHYPAFGDRRNPRSGLFLRRQARFGHDRKDQPRSQYQRPAEPQRSPHRQDDRRRQPPGSARNQEIAAPRAEPQRRRQAAPLHPARPPRRPQNRTLQRAVLK